MTQEITVQNLDPNQFIEEKVQEITTMVGNEIAMTGILVEGVHAVIDLLPDAIEAAPSFGTGAAGQYLLGMGTLDDKFVPILDIDRVLTEDGVLEGLVSEDGEQTQQAIDDSDSASGEASDYAAESA